MKKVTALLLSALLLASALSGCSTAELGYLELSREVASVSEGAIEGQLDILVNFPVIADCIKQWSGEDEDSLGSLSEQGEKKLSLSYSGAYDLSDGILALEMQCQIDGKDYDLGEIYVGTDGKILISVETIYGVMKLAETLDPRDSYAYSEEYRKALEEELSGCRYVAFSIYGEEENEEEIFTELNQELFQLQSVQEGFLNAALTFIKDGHKDFESGLVRKVDGGYEMQMTLSQFPKFLDGYLSYVQSHGEDYRTALNQYLKAIVEEFAALDGSEEISEYAEELQIGAGDWEALLRSIPSIRKGIQDLSENEIFSIFGDSYYKNTIARAGAASYEGAVEAALLYEGRTMVSLTSRSTLEKKSVDPEAPQAQMTMEELEAVLKELSGHFNAVSRVELYWDEPEPGYLDWDWNVIWAYSETEKEEPFWGTLGQIHSVEYENRDGRLYVKLADICDALGLRPLWDEEREQAYVLRGGTPVFVEGFQKDQRTWIPVKELTKLGYGVTYEKGEYDDNIVTIEKQN